MQTKPPISSLRSLPLAFGGTLLLSALLLFSIQPLVGKLLLPLLGGAPAVWNTVMLFFQGMLLLGYAYAHWSHRLFGFKYQPWIHLALLLIAAWQLPFAIGAANGAGGNPAGWVLLTLAGAVGAPVFVLASTAPLLQKWFAATDHPDARDPYFLYSASNAGSFAALLAYPLLIEPFVRLNDQVRFWSVGFWLLLGAIGVCVLAVRQGSMREAEDEQHEPVRWLEAAKWIGLSFVPSSLMLGVTNYITTDVASVPLLWVVPLGLYLLTFVIAFGKRTKRADTISSRGVPIMALAVVFLMLVQATEPVFLLVLPHLFFFFFAALQCHLKLARGRPPAAQLTQYYLYMSLGGVLGGIFNALLAPAIFDSIAEYPIMILAGTLIGFPARAARKSKFRVPPVYGGAMIVLAMTIGAAVVTMAGEKNPGMANLLAAGLLVGSYLLIQTPVRYTLAIATLLICAGIFRQAQSRVLAKERNFFGVMRVVDDPEMPVRKLFHGTTIHGMQFTNAQKWCDPLSYYHRAGPVGEIARLFEMAKLPPEVGLVGLGAGAILTYARPEEHWVLYEIDPAVVRIAQDTNYFTYLSHCSAAPYRIELGDARLKLQGAADGQFGMLIVDAFSSDVIPMHLLTVEALQLYRRKLARDGLLAFHLSSRSFELEPLVANLADALGLYCFTSTREMLNAAATAEGGFEAHWAIIVPPSLLHHVQGAGTWKRVMPNPDGPVWTDDFSSVIRVLRLR